MAQIFTSYVNNVKELGSSANKLYHVYEVEFGTFAELRKHDVSVETCTDLIPSKGLNLSLKAGRITDSEFIALYKEEIASIDFSAMKEYFNSLDRDVLLVGWSRPGLGSRAVVTELLGATELPMLKQRTSMPSFRKA